MNLSALEVRLQRTLPMARIEAVTLPDCGGLRLGLINADFPDRPLPADVMAAVLRNPAYWAFCWGSGLALARLLLAEPHRVRGRTVVDLGSGSGVAAIAAARAGASRVIACDTDPDARAASRVNARLNRVPVAVAASLAALPRDNELLLMADVLYDRSNLELLEAVTPLAREILVADSRIETLPRPGYRPIASMEARTVPNLGEFDEFKTVRIFRYSAAAG